MATLNRTKNATRNIIFGVILKIYQIVVPFLMRTAMIYLMGVRYLGLNSLFTSVMQVLNLAELGVGSAMIFSMYKPIAEDDEETICVLMKLYRTLYRGIGIVIAVVGVAITPFIPMIVKKDVPGDINIYILYLMNLSATVLSYWLMAYKNSILRAYQRTDVISKVTFATNTCQYVLQIFVLWYFRNYYYYVIVLLLTQVMTNLVTAYFANKLYPKYKPRGQVSKELFNTIASRAKDLMTSKIGGVVVDSVDSIVISAFLGLTVLAVYQNYYFVLNSITGIISVMYASCLAGIGNSMVVETKEKNYGDFKTFTFIICWLGGFCSAALLCMYQPFMQLWVKKQELMVDFPVVICFVAYFFVRQLSSLFSVFKDAAGMWHEDRFRPLISAITNLSLNLLLVRFIGIYGIILSTVISVVFVSIPWLLHNLFTVLFEKRFMREYVGKLFYYCGMILISCLLSYGASSFVKGNALVRLIICGVICVIIPNVFFFVIYRKQVEFKNMIALFNKMTKGKLNFIFSKLC